MGQMEEQAGSNAEAKLRVNLREESRALIGTNKLQGGKIGSMNPLFSAHIICGKRNCTFYVWSPRSQWWHGPCPTFEEFLSLFTSFF